MDRRDFLTLGAGALCALGLGGCSSKGSYDDGYTAGYAAGVADAEAKAQQEEEEKAANTPTTGVEATITGASLGAETLTGNALIVLDISAKNVSAEDTTIVFGSGLINVYQDGKGLTPTLSVEGRNMPDFRSVQAGVSLDGWVAYELIDTTTPVECKANQLSDGTTYSGLTNPQTIDPSAL